MFLMQEAVTISEPDGISLCCGAIDLWTALEDGSCSVVLHRGSWDDNEYEAENVGLPLSPTVSLCFHVHLGLPSRPFSHSMLLHGDGLPSSPLVSSSSHHCLCVFLRIWVLV